MSITVPEPHREDAVTAGVAGTAFSLTGCVPVIAAAQYPPSAATCAVYTPAPANAPVNVAALPVPVSVFTRSLPLYNWYVLPAAVFDKANVTVAPVQNAAAEALKSYTAEAAHVITPGAPVLSVNDCSV